MNRYKIIEADVKRNKDDIFPILKKNLKLASNQRYKWNYENCPYGLAKCFLAKHENSDSFVGSSALFPRKIIINNEPVYAYLAGDFAIDKSHRGYGPALKLQKEIKSKLRNTKFKFIYSVPTEVSNKIFIRMNYQEIGKFKFFIKILNTKYLKMDFSWSNPFLNIIIRMMKFLKNFKFFLKLIDFIIGKISKETNNKIFFNYSVEMPELFDARFDLFWEKVSKEYKIIGERNSTFLNWRYKQSPFQEYKIFCILDGKKNIVGYIVYYIQEKKCYIVDMLFLMSKDIIDVLLTKFSLYMRENMVGAIVIDYLGNSTLENKLKEYNFFSLENDNRNVLVYISGFSPESYLLNTKNWHFFFGDIDI